MIMEVKNMKMTDVDIWFATERLKFVNKVIQKHLDNPRASSQKALRNLRAEKTRLTNQLSK